MYHYTVIQWLFFFYFYCFCGWCFESTYVSIKTKKLTNRGFRRGPFLADLRQWGDYDASGIHAL